MNEAIFVAATGLVHQQRRLDVIADNIANINTTGFQASRMNFKEALYTAGFHPSDPVESPAVSNQQKGHGVMMASITRQLRGGSHYITDQSLDFALEGQGYFEVEDATGQLLYTRQGNMYVTENNGQLHLVNADGNFVLDDQGQRIIVPEGTRNVDCGEGGLLTFDDGENNILDRKQLGLYTFVNLTGLEGKGSNYLNPTVASGEKLTATEIKVRQGALEGSNVDLSQEITRMIRTQRALSLASRALRTVDDMEGIANNMRR